MYYISIHASMKDATGFQPQSRSNGQISIHASMKDATAIIEQNNLKIQNIVQKRLISILKYRK